MLHKETWLQWDSFPNHLKETFFILDFFFPRSHCKFFLLLFYIQETCKWVILDLTYGVWGETKYKYVRIPTSDFRWLIWNCPRFILVFEEGEPSSVLSRVLWAGQRPLSWGPRCRGSGRNYAVYKNWRDSLNQELAVVWAVMEGGRQCPTNRRTMRNSLIHALPIYLAQINDFFLCLGQGAGK